MVAIYRLSLLDKTPVVIWQRKNGAAAELRCSPDGDHIAYAENGYVMCESLASGKKQKITTCARHTSAGKEYVEYPDLIWSKNGKRLAVLFPADHPRVVMVTAGSGHIKRIRLPRTKGTIFPLGWLNNDQAFVVKVGDVKPGLHEVWKVN